MAQVTVIPDGHYFRTYDGIVYSNGIYSYDFFSRYLSSFKKVVVIARIKNVDVKPEKSKQASGLNVEFLDLPEYKGPIQYIKNLFTINKKLKEYIMNSECVILRAPSAMFSLSYKILRKSNIPWAMEVVVDPWEYFAPGTIKSWVRPIYRYIWTRDLKSACKECEVVSYVTKSYLQEKYPCKALLEPNAGCFSNSYSSVEIKDGSIANSRIYEKKENTFHLIHVAANVEGYGKGHIVALDIVAELLKRNYDVDITFIGDGTKIPEFKTYSCKIGVLNKTKFLGRLSGVDAVRAELKNADLFIFPTKAEGLPRVLIEAMAEGLPCLSTPVCGIPEILDKSCLFDFNDVNGFTNKIINYIDNPNLLTQESVSNVSKALEFESNVLSKRRLEMFNTLKKKIKYNMKGRSD